MRKTFIYPKGHIDQRFTIAHRLNTIVIFLILNLISITISSQDIWPFFISNFEGAGTVPKKSLAISSNYCFYFARYVPAETIQRIYNSFGISLGMGISNQIDIQMRYDLQHSDRYQDEKNNLILISSKVSNKSRKVAVRLSFGMYFSSENNQQKIDYYVISPRFFFTFPISDVVSISILPMIDIYMENYASQSPQYDYLSVGLNLGLDISKIITKWSVRPEIGINGDTDVGGAGTLTAGIAIIYNLPFYR